MLPCMEEWDLPLLFPQRVALSSWAEKARKVKVGAKEVFSLNGGFFSSSTSYSSTHTQTHTQGLAHTHTAARKGIPCRTQARTSDDTSSWCVLALTPQNLQSSPVLRAGSPAPRTDLALFLSTASPCLWPAQILWPPASPQIFFPPSLPKQIDL